MRQNGYQWTRLAELVLLPQVLARDLDSEIKICKKSSQTLVFCPILGWGKFLRGVISPKQRPKIWQRISPTVCQNASWTHLVVFSRRFYIGRTEGELTIFHQTPISSTDTIDFCSTGHFQVGAKSSFFRNVISGKQGA